MIKAVAVILLISWILSLSVLAILLLLSGGKGGSAFATSLTEDGQVKIFSKIIGRSDFGRSQGRMLGLEVPAWAFEVIN